MNVLQFKIYKLQIQKQKVLQKLRSQKDIIITHPDKGNGIAILNGSDYMKSMTERIIDKKKFIKLTNDPTIKQEEALQRTLRKLNKRNIFSKSEYPDLFPKGSKTDRIYGSPKIHKSFSTCSIFPLRPVISSPIINSLNILVLYFHHIFSQTMQPKTVLIS